MPEFYRALLEKYAYRFEPDLPASMQEESLSIVWERILEQVGASPPTAQERTTLSRIRPEFQQALACFLAASYPAFKRNRQAIASLSTKNFKTFAEFSYCLPATNDYDALGAVYDVWKRVPMETILRSGQRMLQASFTLKQSLAPFKGMSPTIDGSPVSIRTPMGTVLLGSAGNDVYESPDTFLLVEPGGNDLYKGRLAASNSL